MSGARTTIVELEGQRYQINKMTPKVGSYLWQKFVAAGFKAQQAFGGKETPADPNDPVTKELSPEEKMRGVCAVSLTQLDFEDYGFVMREAMRVVWRDAATDVPGQFIPVMSDDGRWSFPDMEVNPMLVTRLMTEALVFNLASFLG